ncbi:hypothetical protein ACQKOH_06405 [Sphingomonas sp. NPDC092331]|jgi:hypothetical protein|uniref:hypothetical protein n=1 Tax=unclassified Sphingomonas TaxID=196159 RepID=UPI0031F5C2DA
MTTRILTGDRTALAIESYVDEFIASRSQMGIGYFLIHAGGKRYGVEDPRACAMGSSYSEVLSRLRREGEHVLTFASRIDARDLAIHVVNHIYDRGFSEPVLPPEWKQEIDALLYANALIWAPDGDAAFDDGSHVLQIDDGDKVRIIAFVNADTQGELESSLADVTTERAHYYAVLREWAQKFELQWMNSHIETA